MATELFDVVSPETALERLLQAGLPEPRVETVALSAAAGRVSARPVRAPEASPSFDRSLMDGFAVRASDTFGATESLPAALAVVGEVPMGAPPTTGIAPGEALVIHTGGMLPPGSDAVVMVEHTEWIDDRMIEVMRPVAARDAVIQRGDDVAEGAVVIPQGARLRSQDLGGLAALGVTHVAVAQAPIVGLIATGDEVVPPDQTPEPGEVRDVNSTTLTVEVERAGGVARTYGIVPDSRSALESAARDALRACDLVVISAGSSVSARDHTSDVIGSLGAPGVLAHGLALKPGKPSIVGLADGRPIFGLPGNPVSALVVFDLLVAPTIRRLQGAPADSSASPLRARLARNVASTAGRLDFIPARLTERDGCTWAEPIFGASNLIFTLVRADALVRIPADANGLQAGAFVDIRPLA
ncbi:MAG: molybdopterin molybdotransferase MoeA [Chloroflexi bacterium]|nr:molybdopterin molybdotransferase MoeA [Chloroflexota bacterium]